MSIDRIQRVNALLQREIAQAILTLHTAEPFDRAAITITGVSVARNLRTAVVSVSIRAPETTREALMALIRRHRTAIQAHINRVMKLKYTPRLHFRLDRAIEKGDHVLGLLLELEETEPSGSDPGNVAPAD